MNFGPFYNLHIENTTFRGLTMPGSSYSQVRPGAVVSVILKADRSTGRQVQGTVREVLTNHGHPRGVEVQLTDGRVGLIQEVLHDGSGAQHYFTPSQQHNSGMPDPQNWQAHTSYPNAHPSSHSQHSTALDPPASQNWQAHTSYPNGFPSPHRQQSPLPAPQNRQASNSFPSGHSSAYTQPHHPHDAYSRPPQTHLLDDSPHVPPDEQSEQMEYLQSYENSKSQSEDDRNQAMLQSEFPDIDSSLIAAIYGDSKSLSATRRMLRELKD
jgi:uncharacterized repeat protein (TIGR03833 family)